MPILGTVASSITGNLASNFMTVIADTGDTINGRDAIHTAGGIYTSFGVSAGTYFGAMKINTAGDTVNWAIKENLGQYSGYDGVNIASDGNPVYTGFNNASGRQSGRVKLNATTGAQIYSYYYTTTGYGNGGTIDGSGNIWSAQQVGSGAGLFKTDADGASPSLWYVNSATYCTRAQYIASTGYIYGLVTGPASTYHLTLFALDSSGNQQFQYEFNTNYSTGGNVVADSSGNLYICSYGADSGTSGGKAFIIKLNSSGSIVAQRTLDSGSGVDGFVDCVIDTTNGFIYTVGSSNNGTTGIIAKYNTSLTLQWQRSLTNVNELASIQLLDADNILVTGGYSGTGAGLFTAKLKTDGSGTGTYAFTGGNVVYSASSLSDSAASYTRSTPGRGISQYTPSRGSTTTINDSVTTALQRKAV